MALVTLSGRRSLPFQDSHGIDSSHDCLCAKSRIELPFSDLESLKAAMLDMIKDEFLFVAISREQPLGSLSSVWSNRVR